MLFLGARRQANNSTRKRSGIIPEMMGEQWKEASVNHVGSSKDDEDTIHHHFIMDNNNRKLNPKESENGIKHCRFNNRMHCFRYQFLRHRCPPTRA